VFATAYSSFNPQDLSSGYLGDIGVPGSASEFSFNVPPNEEFFVVGQQIRDINATDNGSGCVFSVVASFGGCP